VQPVPLVRASSVLPLYRFLERGGGELRAVRERAQPAFRGAELLLPVPLAATLFEETARASGMEDLGLQIGLGVRIESFGQWGPILACAPTAGAFLQAAIARHRLFNTGYRLWTVTRGDEVWLHLRYSGAVRAGRRTVIEYSLAIWLGALRRLLGPAWRPLEIHLEGPPPRHAEALASLSIRGVTFERSSLAIAISRQALARHVPRPRPPMGAADPGPVPANDFTGSARQMVTALLQIGALDLGLAAAAAGMSERSLQRHLGEAGLRFSGLVEEVRFEAACALLANPERRVIDVSTELGYRDAANFTRAFRRWAGVSPQRYRRANAGALAAG
jgi:AraC-like DNA-binding protein